MGQFWIYAVSGSLIAHTRLCCSFLVVLYIENGHALSVVGMWLPCVAVKRCQESALDGETAARPEPSQEHYEAPLLKLLTVVLYPEQLYSQWPNRRSLAQPNNHLILVQWSYSYHIPTDSSPCRGMRLAFRRKRPRRGLLCFNTGTWYFRVSFQHGLFVLLLIYGTSP
jgi:hypothetical protein